MSKLTITEALAEIKTLNARLAKKRDSLSKYILQPAAMKDPMGSESGGTKGWVAREQQSIRDLETRLVAIRTAILKVNLTEVLTIGGLSNTIQEWLTWRKEVAPGLQRHQEHLLSLITRQREERRKAGAQVGEAATGMQDIVVNIDEAKLLKDIETVAEVLGTLDGLLSLKNATVTIEVA